MPFEGTASKTSCLNKGGTTTIPPNGASRIFRKDKANFLTEPIAVNLVKNRSDANDNVLCFGKTKSGCKNRY